MGDKKLTTVPKSFVRSSLIYAIGDLLTKGARIVLIPYFIACLTKEEVGLLAILQAIIFASWTLLSFGFGHAVQRFYNSYAEDKEPFATSVWFSRLLVSVPFYAAMMFAGSYFVRNFATDIPEELIWLAISAGFFRAGLNITELWLIIREQALAYRTFTFFQFLMTTLLTIYLISWRGMGVKGALLAELITCIFWTIIAAGMHLRAGWPRRGLINWRESLTYCLPVLPHALCMWAMSGIDRILLEQQGVSKADIGEYHIGYLLASVVSIGAMAMRSAWLPSFFKEQDREKSRAEFGKTATLFFYFVAFAVVGAFAFAPEIVALFSSFGSASYSRAADVMRIVVFGIAGLSLFFGFNQPLFYERRIGLIASISGIGLLVNVVMNLMLIPEYGIFGAAIATLGAYLTIAVLLLGVITLVYKVHWELTRLFFISVCAILFGLIALAIPSGSLIVAVVLKSLLMLTFLAITLFKIDWTESDGWKISTRFEWLRSARNSPAPNSK